MRQYSEGLLLLFSIINSVVVGAASCQYYHVERKRIDLYTVCG